MLVCNQQNDNTDFYGTVYASGIANIYGNVDLLSIDVTDKKIQSIEMTQY